MITPGAASAAFEEACRTELRALKPGNVHDFGAGHGVEVAHFEAAATAAAPRITRPGLSVGARISGAVEASLQAAGGNTNLGIVLLAAPLVAAALDGGREPFRERLFRILGRLDVGDARDAFAAIALASPGGLGEVPTADVRAPATVSLREAMALAADRDLIARQYVTDYADVFAIAVPRLTDFTLAPLRRVEATYLDLLATYPDTHITRKFGLPAAEEVRREAAELRARISGADGSGWHTGLAIFDAVLKARGLNPGTSADMTVAGLLAVALERLDTFS